MRLAGLAMVTAMAATAAQAQAIPEISARCQAENARMSGLIQAQCLALGTVAAKLACTKRLRISAHADPECMAESRAHVVALQRACLAHTAPDS